jgi:TRAP-type mannitol/chloroaromatic compound transport system permease small subunit
MHQLRAFSDGVDAVLSWVARLTGWLFLAAIFVICFDVITRKVGFQLPYFTSTRLQELEWHLTATLFLGWLAFGVMKNTHVRIDVLTMSLARRTRDWIDLVGVVVFALPMCLIIVPYAWDYALTSWAQWEGSDAPNGLPARYVIKTIAAAALTLLLLSALSLLARKIVDLFGPPSWHSKAKPGEGVEV